MRIGLGLKDRGCRSTIALLLAGSALTLVRRWSDEGSWNDIGSWSDDA